MKRCPKCGKKSIVKELRWEGSKSVLVEVCCNYKCESYKPYVRWSGK